MNREILLENDYKEWEPNIFHETASLMYQKRFRNDKGQTMYFITIYEYQHEVEPNYEVELQFEQNNYVMNITMFCFQHMTLQDIEREVYVIWHGLNCKYYEE